MTAIPARVISITSGKGGVGKTHTTVNLGLALAKLGKRVLLLDADLGLANINVMLGFQPKATLREVFRGEKAIRDIVVNYHEGLDIIPASSGVPELTNLSEQERLRLIDVSDEFASQYDYLLIDTAAGIGDNVLYFNTAAQEILVIIDPEPTSITDAYAVIKVLSTQHGRKEFSILVNRAAVGTDGRGVYGQLASAADRFLQVKLKFLGAIAEDSSVTEAVIAQKPYLHLFPSAKASRDMQNLAKKIAADNNTRVLQGGVQFFFRSLLEAR